MTVSSPDKTDDKTSARSFLGAAGNPTGRAFARLSSNGSFFDTRLKRAFLALVALTILIVVLQSVVREYQVMTASQTRMAASVGSLLQHQKKRADRVFGDVSKTLSGNAAFQQAMLNGNLAEVGRITDNIIARKTQDVALCEFTIYTPNRRVFYQSFGTVSRKNRETAFEKDLSGHLYRTTNGLEFGNKGEIIASIFQPMTQQGYLIGYLKLAANIEQPLSQVAAALGIEIVKVFNRYPDIPVQGTPNANIFQSPVHRYEVFGANTVPQSVVDTIMNLNAVSSWVLPFHIDGSRILHFKVLTNEFVNGGPDAKLLVLRDVSETVWAGLANLLLTIGASLGLGFCAWLLFKHFLGRLQASVKTAYGDLQAAVTENTLALSSSRENLLEAQKIASVGSWERDLTTNEVDASDEFFRIMDIPPDCPKDTIQDVLLSRLPVKDLTMSKRKIHKAIVTCGGFDFEHCVSRRDGTTGRVHVRGYVKSDENGNPIRLIGTAHEITQRWQAEHQNKLLANILSTALNEIYIVNAETFECEYANTCALDNLGYTLEEIQSRKIWDISQQDARIAIERDVTPLLRGETGSLSFVSKHSRKDGSEYPVDLQVHVLKDRGRKLLVGIANDITERVQRENEAREAKDRAELLAYFDPLTKLSNRAGCQRDAKIRFSKDGKPAFLAHVDMDNFKRVNDSLGHLAGDYCLQETGRRLREVCRGLGTPYRWGGDEFVILADTNHSDPNELCERARRIMREPMEFNGNRFWPTVSIGIAQCPDDGTDFATLLVNADIALYQSKDSGKDRFTFFDADMKEESAEEEEIVLELHRAVKNDEFFLEFQPQVNLRSQTVTGVEALIRWQHPDRGVLAPGQFLSVVEKCGLAPVVGKIVIDKALAAARAWQDKALEFGRISINLSPAHLSSGQLLEHFKASMAAHGVSPSRVTAEVLESVFLDDTRSCHLSTLTELNELGVHIELDDFGTGYASLTHVADLPINGLKVDRSFTNQMLDDRKKEVVINQLIHLARSLDIKVVCEGVETEAEYDRLRMMGDFSIQGYLVARPMPFDQITSWMNESAEDLYFVI